MLKMTNLMENMRFLMINSVSTLVYKQLFLQVFSALFHLYNYK